MTIPASQLVDITPRVIGGGLSGLEFVGTFVTKNTRLPTGTAVPFYSQSSVGDYFGMASNEYKLAGNYFLADSNSSKKPSVLWFYRFVDTAAAAFLRGVASSSLAELKDITAGTLTITIDGTEKALTALDFSSASDMPAVATVVSSALSTAGSCSWDNQTRAFVITSATTGEESTITYASGTAAVAMGLTAGTLSQGAVAESLTQCMEGCVNSNANFWSFMPLWEETSTEAVELAGWCNNQGVRFLYVMVDDSSDALVANSVACLAYQLKDYIGVCPIYDTKELGAMAMGVGASIDVARLNGRKTWAFKAQSGLAFTVDNKTIAPILLENGYNFYGSYATASERFKFFQNGQCTGSAKWLDTYYGQVFLKDGLQNAWLNILMLNNTIPYNEAGYGLLRAASMDVINQGINAGFIRQGVSLSEAQKATVQSEAGLDISGSLETNGWYLQILDPTTQVRQERGTPVISFWYMDGGSIQHIIGTSTVIL